ncbi:MAG: transcriptional regulator HexR [Candidatus Competibacteraceae bacterium]|nr:transcriptional regulator HexR [Candidatus Competibacteraceae bacterium]
MLNTIQASRGELRKSERKVADLVLEQPDGVINASIATLAQRAGVSEPTVIRFCRALGCTGFQDFKLRLAQSLASGVPYLHSDVQPGERAPALVQKLFDRSIVALLQVRDHLDGASVERAVEILSGARKIEFYGHGASGIVALDAQHKFFRLGTPVAAYSDPHTHSMAATILTPEDAVVAISHTGRSTDLLTSCRLALAAGARVIAVTARRSPLAQLATVALSSDVSEDTNTYIPMSSRIADLVIMDVLAVGVALSRGPELLKQLEKTKRILTEKHLS